MRKVVVVFALAVGLLALMLPSAGAAPTLRGDYVALGDSYTAGPLIPNQIIEAGMCGRSDHNYPHLVAPTLGATEFRDASCSGAQTKDMTATQTLDGPDNPPQFDRLDGNTRLVTLGISGNDIGFTSIFEDCKSATPTGHPCQDAYVRPDGSDELRDRINNTAPKVAAVLKGIKTRSSKAKILVVGYPAIFPDTGTGCWPQMPIAPDDVPYLRGIEKALNGMLATVAAANRARYVDTYTPSLGHDACQPLTINRWVEPVVPNQPAFPVHPNAAGEQGMANAVLAAL